MNYIVYLLASGIGVAGLVWSGSRHNWRIAVFAGLGAASAAVLYWMLAVPSFDGRAPRLVSAVAMLLGAILLPGGAGAGVARSKKWGGALAAGVLVSLLLWLPMAYLGLFSVCAMDPRCDL